MQFNCARCKLCLKTFSLSNMGKQAAVSHAKTSGHVRNVAEKSGQFDRDWRVATL